MEITNIKFVLCKYFSRIYKKLFTNAFWEYRKIAWNLRIYIVKHRVRPKVGRHEVTHGQQFRLCAFAEKRWRFGPCTVRNALEHVILTFRSQLFVAARLPFAVFLEAHCQRTQIQRDSAEANKYGCVIVHGWRCFLMTLTKEGQTQLLASCVRCPTQVCAQSRWTHFKRTTSDGADRV